jgi:hypothetical protein
MKIRKPCPLAAMYASPKHPILASAPELMFMSAVCGGLTDEATAIFRETKLFGGKASAVDTPYGRFEGLAAIRAFAEGFLAVFHAEAASLKPVIQTRANGYSVTELVVNLVVDGEIEQVPMFLVGELRTPDTLEELRIYCHFSFVPGLTAYRRPLFQSAHLEMGDPGLLTGSVREYYEALHHVPAVDVDRIMGSMGDNCQFGGYEPYGVEHSTAATRADIRAKYEHMATYIPRCVGMRYETIIDDGVNCIIEWVHIVSEAGQSELGRVALSGIAAYERGEDGLLCAIRISDYAGYERTIDWNRAGTPRELAYQTNLVHEFPAGVGRKQQT